MRPPSSKQTLSTLRNLLRRRGLVARSELGQNFLVDLNLQQVLVDAADLVPDDVVLEVGAGTGGLTRCLAERAGHVVAVEFDRGFFQLAADHVADLANVTVLEGDALATKNRLNPEMMDLVAEHMRRHGTAAFKLVANLPYSIATPLLINLLLAAWPMRAATVTVQRELADRLEARPATPPYNASSVTVQALADITRLRNLGPEVFWPRPKVDSAFVQIVSSTEKRAAIDDPAALSRCTRMIFTQRRKHILRVLRNHYKGRATADELRDLLEGQDIDPALRAEALPVDRFVALAEALTARFPESR